ncbi:VOC family protein [Actinomadura fulvescens]
MVHVTSNAPTGTPNWLDLGIPDMARAKEFYGTVFGWEFQDYGPEAGHYHAVMLQGKPVAGMMKNPDDAPSEYWWQTYFATEDCDGTVKRASDAGATVLMAPDDIMDQGRMAVLSDPTGAQFGLWQGRAHVGSQIVNEPGSLVWSELVTADPGAAGDFYRAVFEYTLEDMPGGFDYTVFNRPDGRAIGGMLGRPDTARPAWTVYFEVADPDEAVRRARDTGGTVVAEPEDSPYGRIAAVKDPFGAEFNVMRSAPPEGT